MARLKVFTSETFNPWFNLATEDWIFHEMDPSVQTLFLWRNEPTVVVGRNQNPWGECNLSKMESDGVHLARRTSGGGAVFHDLGNTCFTFLSPREGYDRNVNVGIILEALKTFSITAEASGRNDIIVAGADGPLKVSGSAYRETRDRAFHHGTLLLNTDLSRLADYLTPHPKKLQSKGKTSVRSRVTNLSEFNSACDHQTISTAIQEAFFKRHGGRCEVEALDQSSLERIERLKGMYERFSSWDWRFGHAPQFTIEFAEYLSWGFMQVYLDSDKGHVTRLQVFSDALFPDLIQTFEAAFLGQPFSRLGVEQAIDATLSRHPQHGHELSELRAWLASQVEV